jgi:2-polyprenyl-3-methyl-5-hydroxy-6-metoxy-1,4-benzoquinol methylase
MEKKVICPLCFGKDLIQIEKIKTKYLIASWLKQGINIKGLFKNIETLTKIKCKECSLGFFDPFVPGDDAFYSKLGKEEWYYSHEDKTEFKYANNYIKPKDCILDIGSGRGVFAKYIDKNIAYTGLELSSKAVDCAASEGINVIGETIEHHSKYNSNKYDLVVAFQVLEHIVDVDSFLKSSISVVKNEGILVIAVPNNDSFIKYAKNSLLNLPPHHLIHWNEKSLRYLADKYNLEVVDVYKEKVTNVHKAWFYSIMIAKIIRDKFGVREKTMSMDFSNKAILKISFVLARIFKFLNVHFDKDGHTIAISLRKKY